MIVDPSVPPGRYRLRQGQPVNAARARPNRATRPLGLRSAPEPAFAGRARRVRRTAVPSRSAAPGGASPGHDGTHPAAPGAGLGAGYGMPTVMERREPSVPVLRLVTGDLVAETRTSGARAGRGPVELALPEVPTVSREHARFTFSGGQWRVANLGMNGLTINGEPVAGEHPVSDGDAIRWGTRPDALASRVEIR